MSEISEELVAVIRERIVDTLGSRIAAECLMALADRGWFNYRRLPEVAEIMAARYGIGQGGDLSQIENATLQTFASASGLQPLAPDIPPGLTQQDMDWLEDK